VGSGGEGRWRVSTRRSWWEVAAVRQVRDDIETMSNGRCERQL
jgi:hypothetical protein